MPQSEIQKRRVSELIALYSLEPSLFDVFVEGSLDQTLIAWALERARKSAKAGVYRISSVEVPTAEVLSRGQDDGERGRVVTLAKLLEEAAGVSTLPVLCVADLDLDGVEGSAPTGRYLALTDFTSMELYLFDLEVFRKYFHVALKDPPLTPEEFFNLLCVALQDLFAFRVAKARYFRSAPHAPFWDYCRIVALQVSLDLEAYLGRHLTTLELRQRREELSQAIQSIRRGFRGDCRNYIHGKDFLELFVRLVRAHAKSPGLRNPEAIETTLTACLEFADLSATPLFHRLLNTIP